MARKRPRGLIRELRDVLVLVEDLDRDAQKMCARLLRSVVRTFEERETMTEEECRIVREMRLDASMRRASEHMKEVRRRFRDEE